MLAHMVYFSLHEPTAENRKKMVDACQKYLTGHPGEVFFSAGTCADYSREVNDRVEVARDRALDDLWVAQVALYDLDVAIGEVDSVGDDDLVPSGKQTANDVSPDEAGSSGNQNPHSYS